MATNEALSLLWAFIFFIYAAAAPHDASILLQFKEELNNPHILESWNSSNSSPCDWNGVTCNANSTSVSALHLGYFELNGTLSSTLCQLDSLQILNLTYNGFGQEFPVGLLECLKLSTLDLSQNYFVGLLPDNISAIAASLNHLDLSGNNFTGSVPQDFSKLSNLEYLSLEANLLTEFPQHLAKLTNLKEIRIGWNPFSPGPIPPEFGNLTNLHYLSLAGGQFTGSIPSSLGNLKNLVYFDLSQNNLTSSIPKEILFLPNLTQLELYVNSLSGSIPDEISNLTSLTDLDLSQNYLNGSIPQSISLLRNLRLLQLNYNNLTGEIPDGLSDLKELNHLVLFRNALTGQIPYLIGKNSKLIEFDVSSNKLSGTIPPYLCSGGALRYFTVFKNRLSGAIPQEYGKCKSLQRAQFYNNSLEGAVPSGLWGSPELALLRLDNNKMNGTISSDISSASNLANLILDNNQFSGQLPKELGQLPHLQKLQASNNKLSGTLLFGNCSSLVNLVLSHNQFSGSILDEVSNCANLTELNLSSNNFSGSIPKVLGKLEHLSYLDLSNNYLTGEIPTSLSNLNLLSLNLSYNELQGQVPTKLGQMFSSKSFEGNTGLCGYGTSKSCIVSKTKTKTGKSTRNLILALFFSLAAIALLLIAGTCLVYKQNGKRLELVGYKDPKWKITPFHMGEFNGADVTEQLEENNVVGSGRSGKVYKVTLMNGETVAVKKLWRWPETPGSNSDHEFMAEVETLGKIRHRNIVKLLCCCSSTDSDLLVYEYMPNGSLEDVLHGPNCKFLNWHTRFRIALGIADALAYLHHGCQPPILHRDVKSSNILLDEKFEAKLADFGLAKLYENSATMSNVAGTHGYFAPEYAYSIKVNEKSDIYSFGVVLLELITGKKAMDAEFGEGMDIVQWIRSKIRGIGGPERVLDEAIKERADKQQMGLVLRLALLCTTAAPSRRPSMRDLVEMLKLSDPAAKLHEIWKLRSHSLNASFSSGADSFRMSDSDLTSSPSDLRIEKSCSIK